MDKKNKNDAACSLKHEPKNKEPGADPKLTPRDQFAIHALQGIAGNSGWSAKTKAAMAYEIADAMLEVRSRGD